MKSLRMIKSGFKTAWAHKLRSVFMILSVVTGIAALTIVISLGRGTEEKMMTSIRKFFAPDNIMVVAAKGKMGNNQRMSGSTATLKTADFEEIAGAVENIEEWDAVQMSPAREVSYAGKNSVATVYAHTPAGESVWNLNVVNGRFFSESENKSLTRVALLAPAIAEELFGSADPVGKEIRISGIPFQVIGVIAHRGMDPHGIDQDSEILIPLNTMLRRVVNLDYVMMGKIRLADEKQAGRTVSEISDILKRRHGTGGGADADFMIITPAMVSKIVKDSNRIFGLYLPVIAVVCLLIGALVIANLMLVSVKERTSEIGIRIAVGAKTSDIMLQFLMESLTVTASSGIIGVGLGLLLLGQLSPRLNIPYSVSLSAVIACFSAAVITGILAGIIPAKKAATLKPVEALKQ